MPHTKNATKRSTSSPSKPRKDLAVKDEVRYTVGLAASVARQVERYAQTADTSRSKAIATLVRLGLEGQEIRKREFFKKLKANLDDNDPARQDLLVDEFRALILGR